MFIKVQNGQVRTAGQVDHRAVQVVTAQKGTWAKCTMVNLAHGPSLPVNLAYGPSLPQSTSPMGQVYHGRPRLWARWTLPVPKSTTQPEFQGGQCCRTDQSVSGLLSVSSNLMYIFTALEYFGKYFEIISQTGESHWPSDAPLHQKVLIDFIMAM